MSNDWQFFLVLIGCALLVQGFFAMLEMACVSFNKVRLQYYLNKGNRRARWLSYLLKHPALLFGTTLIGVNASLQIGSEAARRFYEAVGLSPDWAPLSQIILVLFFAETAPMVAGRRFAENVVMLGMPIIYFCSLLFRPFIWLLDMLCSFINRILHIRTVEGGQYLSREELQKVFEAQEEMPEEFNTVVANIFSLKNKTAKELMHLLKDVQLISSVCSVRQLRSLLSIKYSPYIPIYQKNLANIIAIAYPRDLLRLSDEKKVREFARTPWFIAENASILQILKQFRRNNQSVAVVLNSAGLAIGVLTLDEIVDEVFGTADEWMSFGDIVPRMHHIVVDRTFSGDMAISDFNKQYKVHLTFSDGIQTLEELVTEALGHPPTKGETVRIDQFELSVEEAPLFGAKMISVRTIF